MISTDLFQNIASQIFQPASLFFSSALSILLYLGHSALPLHFVVYRFFSSSATLFLGKILGAISPTASYSASD